MFIGGLCKVKISSPKPTRRKEKIPDGNCRGTGKGLYAPSRSLDGVAGWLGKVIVCHTPASSMNLFVRRQGLI